VIDVEEQLRHEMQAAAERIKPDSVRPLRAPRPRRRSRTVRWLAPVAAAAAVAGLIVGVTVAGHTTHPPAQRLGSLLAGMPKYYVTVNTPPRRGVRAVVRASATGAPISSVQIERSQPRVPGEWNFAITGAASDRAFLITTQTAFELLRLTPDGHVLRLTRLPRKVWDLSGFGAGPDVLSPNGTEIVMPSPGGIAMYSVTTGAVTKWLGPKGVQDAFEPENWPGHGHEVFVSDTVGNFYYLLNVAAPGGGLLANSRSIRIHRLPHGYATTGWWLLPDRRTLLAAITRLPERATSTGRILEISTRTGRFGRVLYRYSHVPGSFGCFLDSLGPARVHVLISCGNRFGRLDGSHFTRLPGPSSTLPVAAW
jgi:hypothetical protein